jgi:outer membrane autotransporter protein
VILDHLTDIRDSVRSNQDSGAAMAYAASPAKKDPISGSLKSFGQATFPTARPAIWARAYGDFERRTGDAQFTFGGIPFNPDVGFQQRIGGLTAGGDLVISGLSAAKDAFIFGMMVGGTESHVNLSGSPTHETFTGPSAGVYGTYLNGGWFTDVLFKIDSLSLDINGLNLLQTATLQNYNAVTNVGYKFDVSNRFYVEPTAGLEYVNSQFSESAALTPTSVPLMDGHALRGRVGARVGTEWVSNNIRIEPSLAGFAYSILEASNAALFLEGGGPGIILPSDKGQLRGQIQAAVNFLNLTTGLAGFVRADGRFGDNLIAAGARFGIRQQW